ncbi:MAG: hypothetical protein MUF24_03795 [Chitinophagaceae bacterium]|jgi:hypothetical protein|nr:hypothetical protein [Chitinophagaceae bacterium]
MAHPNLELIEALRETARRLKNGAHYAWGHHGSCNCGNLLQTVTDLSSREILQYSRSGTGEWTELAQEFCGVTEAPVDLLIAKLHKIGLTPSDVHCIEYLQDKQVLDRLPGGFRWLRRNVREDVVLYMETMAEMLEEKLLKYDNLDVNGLMASLPEVKPANPGTPAEMAMAEA